MTGQHTTSHAPAAGGPSASGPVQQPAIMPADVESLAHKLRDWMPTLRPAEQALLAGILQRAAADTPSPPRVPSRFPLLEVTVGPAAGQTLLFAQPEVLIGRQAGNDLVITDRGVSARHAHIQQQPNGAFRLVDLQSTNGTHLNGRQIDGSCDLSDGDLIRMGSTELRFHVAVEQIA